MDFTTQEWLTALILLLIAGIFLDGFRRMRRARRDSLHMSLDVKNTSADNVSQDANFGSEFPNGGARVSDKGIDEERIAKIRSQYDFGADLTNTPVADDTDEMHERPYNSDQWVDSDEGDEDYYGKKWDDDYDFDADEKNNEDTEVEPAIPATDEQDSHHIEKVVVDSIDDVLDYVPAEDEAVEQGLEQSLEDRHVRTEPVIDEHVEESRNTVTSSMHEPEQVPLNLEESVPVLMDAADDEVQTSSNTGRHYEPALGNIDDGLEIRPVAKSLKQNVEPTIGDNDDLGERSENPLGTRSANKPRYESKYFASKPDKASPDKKEQPVKSELQEVLVLHVKAVEDYSFHGADLLQQVLDNGLRYGAMDIFHYHSDEDGEGPVIFSMANMLKPGIFNLKTINDFTTVGVTFFLTLPVVDNANMAAFDVMLTTAKNIAEQLGGELKDDQRSVMTAQTVEHYRERIRDFARRQQLEKNKR